MNKQTNIHYGEQQTPPLDTLEPSPQFAIPHHTRLCLPKGQFLMYFPSLTRVLNASITLSHSSTLKNPNIW